jgi:hypothetical protein
MAVHQHGALGRWRYPFGIQERLARAVEPLHLEPRRLHELRKEGYAFGHALAGRTDARLCYQVEEFLQPWIAPTLDVGMNLPHSSQDTAATTSKATLYPPGYSLTWIVVRAGR